MKTRTIAALCILAVTILMIFVLLGCGGSRRDLSDTEEAAFSDSGQEHPASEADTVRNQTDEEEVMRLLGLAKKAESEKQPTSAKVGPADTAAVALKSQSAQLEQDLQNRNLEIANLKTELAERDRRIAELEAEMNKPIDTAKTKKVRSSGTYKERYDYARSLYESRNYRQAMQEFAALISTDSKNELADNCQYWIGECYYGLRAYNQAIMEFEKVFTFNQSDKYDDALLKLGYSYLRIGNVEKAKSEFNQLITDYPDSEFAAKAQHYLQQL